MFRGVVSPDMCSHAYPLPGVLVLSRGHVLAEVGVVKKTLGGMNSVVSGCGFGWFSESFLVCVKKVFPILVRNLQQKSATIFPRKSTHFPRRFSRTFSRTCSPTEFFDRGCVEWGCGVAPLFASACAPLVVVWPPWCLCVCVRVAYVPLALPIVCFLRF